MSGGRGCGGTGRFPPPNEEGGSWRKHGFPHESEPKASDSAHRSVTAGNTTVVDAIELMRTLRAVRRFADAPVADEALADVLEVARWTGSAKNRQPWELVVVKRVETLQALSRLGRFAGHLAGAPLGVALVLDQSSGSANVLFDEGRLAERIMLAAWAHRVGSCVATLFPEQNVRAAGDLLGIPDGHLVRTVVALGYPADEEARYLSATPELRAVVPIGRKSATELVSWERYGQRSTTAASG
jgi:nitroreductase